MRIDEFSAPGNIDGSLNIFEIRRFLLFGLDYPSIRFDEEVYIDSPINLLNSIYSPVQIQVGIYTYTTTELSLNSKLEG